VVRLPHGFHLRPPRDEDAAAVAALVNDESEAPIGPRVISTGWKLRRWTAPSVDRENDVAVVEAPDGSLCAATSVEADPPYTRVPVLGAVARPSHGREEPREHLALRERDVSASPAPRNTTEVRSSS
jgi:hypothetical protein